MDRSTKKPIHVSLVLFNRPLKALTLEVRKGMGSNNGETRKGRMRKRKGIGIQVRSPPSFQRWSRLCQWVEEAGETVSRRLFAVLFCSLAVLDPRVGHTMDVLSPFIPVLCHSD